MTTNPFILIRPYAWLETPFQSLLPRLRNQLSVQQPVRTFTCSVSSKSKKKWYSRHTNDPYVRARSNPTSILGATDQAASLPPHLLGRAAFKLFEIDAVHKIFRPGLRVVDLGASPGSWTQVILSRMGYRDTGAENLKDGLGKNQTVRHKGTALGRIVCVDLNDLSSLVRGSPGVHFVKGDFTSPDIQAQVVGALRQPLTSPQPNTSDGLNSVQQGDGKADCIVSDMLGNLSGNVIRDEENSIQLSREVVQFARQHLRSWSEDDLQSYSTNPQPQRRALHKLPPSYLVLKHWAGHQAVEFYKNVLKRLFAQAKVVKPKASKAESLENYFVCFGLKEKALNDPTVLQTLHQE